MKFCVLSKNMSVKFFGQGEFNDQVLKCFNGYFVWERTEVQTPHMVQDLTRFNTRLHESEMNLGLCLWLLFCRRLLLLRGHLLRFTTICLVGIFLVFLLSRWRGVAVCLQKVLGNAVVVNDPSSLLDDCALHKFNIVWIRPFITFSLDREQFSLEYVLSYSVA